MGNADYYQYARKIVKHDMPEQACKDKPVILFMDSLNADNVDDMMRYLREYLELEYLEKKVVNEADKKYFTNSAYNWQSFNWSTLPHYKPVLPQQKNFTDCGLFVLQYAESFLLQPDFVLNDLHQRSGTLFHSRIVDSKRDEIMRMIVAIAEGTIPVEMMGQRHWLRLKSYEGKKTHFKKVNPNEGDS